ncbi:MAG: hypothetical protein K2J01_03050 [Clostridiales bacterium]|nr:hypothetical protein [Clostridiales bacterium]
MNKAIKKRIATVTACLASAVMCFGALTACGGGDDGSTTTTPPEAPQHITAVAAKCTTAGNIEYWTKGGKYYSDADCKTEITQAATVLAALNHDFENAPYVNTDPTQHWQVCKRTDCDETTTKEAHATSGTCVCGKVIQSAATTYDVEIANVTNGTVTADKTKAAEGETVTLTVTPAEGYILATLVYNDGEDHDIKDTKTFTMPNKKVTVTATFELEQQTPTFDPTAFELQKENDTLGAVMTPTENSVKVSASAPDGTDWHIKLVGNMDAVTIGHFYEVTYAINYKVMSDGEEVENPDSGEVWFETTGVDGYDYYEKRNVDLVKGDNTVKFTFRANKTEAAPTAVLQLGKLPAGFEVEVTALTIEEKANVGNDIIGWSASKHDTVSDETATISKHDNADGTFVVTITGEVSGDDAWKLKLEKDVNLIDGHEYELKLIYTVSGGGEGNTEHEVYGGKATYETYTDGAVYYNSEFDSGKLNTKTIKFTAAADYQGGSCFKLGQWTDSANPLTFTVFYMELTDLTIQNSQSNN